MRLSRSRAGTCYAYATAHTTAGRHFAGRPGHCKPDTPSTASPRLSPTCNTEGGHPQAPVHTDCMGGPPEQSNNGTFASAGNEACRGLPLVSHSSCCYMLLLGMQDEIWSEMAGDRRRMTFEKLNRNRHPRGRCSLLLSLQVNEPRQQHPPPEPQSGTGVAAPTSSAGSAANVSSRSANGLGLDTAGAAADDVRS